MRRRVTILLIVLLLAAVDASAVRAQVPVSVTLSTDQLTYRAGQAVTLSLTVTNPFNAPVTLAFASAQEYDFLIAAATDQHELWHWSDTRAFTQIGHSRQIAPHSTVTFTEVWDQRDKAGQPVPPGAYVVTAHLSATVAVDAPPLIFTILPPELEVRLHAGRTQTALGQSFVLTLDVHNPGSTAAVLTFPTAQLYDFVVYSSTGQTVWRWSQGQLFSHVQQSRVLAPYQTLHFTETWDHHGQTGQHVPPGTYGAVARLMTTPSYEAPPLSLVIEQAAPLLSLTTDHAAYPPGTPVLFTLVVTNPTDEPLPLAFPTDQDVDFIVVDTRTQAVVWRWEWGRTFLPAPTIHTVPPSGTITLAGRWDQQLAGNAQAADGVYAVTARLATITPLSSLPVTFTIHRPNEAVPLVRGCNNVALSWPAGTAAATVAAAVMPPSALLSIWRHLAAANRFQGYAPQAGGASDLLTVNRLEPVFICTSGPATLTRPTLIQDERDAP